jgi:hypothetical protein
VTHAPRGTRPPAGSRLQAIRIPGPAGLLEGLLQERETVPAAFAAVVCHPHPLYGGTLHNKVTHRLAAVLHELGGAVVRFNFRGVGESEGTYDAGIGELEDARAAMGWVRARHPRARRWAAGFSFGSWVAARLAAGDPGVGRLILVAPPVGTADFSALHGATVPKLVIQGTADQHCPRDALEREIRLWADPKAIAFIDGATHFFDKRLGELADVLRQHLAGPASAGTSSIT